MKQLLALALTLMSFASIASCASSVSELKNLVGDRELSLSWLEAPTSNRLRMLISDRNGAVHLRLVRQQDGKDWANMEGSICLIGGTSYRVNLRGGISWGPASPSIIRGASIGDISLNIPSSRSLQISVKAKLAFFSKTYRGSYTPI